MPLATVVADALHIVDEMIPAQARNLREPARVRFDLDAVLVVEIDRLGLGCGWARDCEVVQNV